MISAGRGFIQTQRIDHHPAVGGDDIGQCALCSKMIWVDARIALYRTMNPSVPVLCCVCGPMSRDALLRAFPGMMIPGREVPDLSHLMN